MLILGCHGSYQMLFDLDLDSRKLIKRMELNQYDLSGNLIRTYSGENGFVYDIQIKYDDRGSVSGRTSIRSNAVELTTWGWDNTRHNYYKTKDFEKLEHYAFDDRGYLASVKVYNGNRLYRTYHYQYDDRGRLIEFYSMDDSGGQNTRVKRNFTYFPSE